MFQGVVHANARKILASWIPVLPASVHVLCSGNFTIESTLRLNGYKGRLSGCDVSLYTCSLGCAFTGIDLPLALNSAPEFAEFAPLAPFLSDPIGRAAAVAVALDALRFSRRKNHYESRMMDGYGRRFAELCEKTAARIRSKAEAIQLDEFHCEDAWQRMAAIPPGDGELIATFPPTYSAGYERLYRDLERLFVWAKPSYRELTSGVEFAQRVVQRSGPWIIGAEKPTPELEGVIGKPVGIAPRGTGVSIRLYSNLAEPKVVRRQILATDARWPRLTDDDEITPDSLLALHRVTSPEANYLRQLYVSAEVAQASAQYSYVVAIDGKVAGLLLFQQPTFGTVIEGANRQCESIYMMTDLSVPSTNYPRLSKLILLAATSAEMRTALERRMIQEVRYNVTTAFSRHPSSMKYRGIFKLLSRKRQPDGVYVLNYYGPMGHYTLKEALTRWMKLHCKATSPA